MSERRCGYCRDFGHTVPNCRKRELQRQAIARHVYGERKLVHQRLLDNGFGVGAILQDTSDENKLFIIESLSGNNMMRSGELFEDRNVKYSKEVRITLRSVGQYIHYHIPDMAMVVEKRRNPWITLRVTDLSDMSNGYYASVCGKQLGFDDAPAASFSWYHDVRVVAPSSDTDATEDDFNAAFYMPLRLLKGKRERQLTKPLDLFSP